MSLQGTKVYLAAPAVWSKEVRTLAAALRAKGVTVTSRWLDEVDTPAGRERYNGKGPHPERAADAARCLEDINNSDVLILLSAGFASDVPPFSAEVWGPGVLPGRGGCHFECGYAKGRGIPVVLVGEWANVFSDLADVWYRDVKTLFSRITSEGVLASLWQDSPQFATLPATPAPATPGPNHHALISVTHDDLMPTRAYSGDAGYDLYVAEDMVIPSGQFRDVPSGVSMALPDGVWAMITGRSSTIRNRGLLVTTGIIDTGWRGPLFSGVQNIGPNSVQLKRGERIAQLIPMVNVAADMRLVTCQPDELPTSDRGTNGFGSSGS